MSNQNIVLSIRTTDAPVLVLLFSLNTTMANSKRNSLLFSFYQHFVLPASSHQASVMWILFERIKQQLLTLHITKNQNKNEREYRECMGM